MAGCAYGSCSSNPRLAWKLYDPGSAKVVLKTEFNKTGTVSSIDSMNKAACDVSVSSSTVYRSVRCNQITVRIAKQEDTEE